MYVKNLHETTTESDLGELIGLRTINSLKLFILPLCHV